MLENVKRLLQNSKRRSYRIFRPEEEFRGSVGAQFVAGPIPRQRQQARRLLRARCFQSITGQYPGEPRRFRRKMARKIAKQAYREQVAGK